MEKFLAKSKTQPAASPNGQPKVKPEPQPLRGDFWRFAVLFSFIMNVVLLLVLAGALGLIFQIKGQIAQPLIGGLHDSFIQMQQASIVSSIPVSDTITVNDHIPVVFDLPLNQQTTVTLVQDTRIPRTLVNLNGVPIPTDIVLPAGTPLNITLNLTVPVSQTIPVVLKVPIHIQVPVNIPLAQTQLNSPFTQLAGLVAPYDALLKGLPSTWSEAVLGH